MRIIHGLTMIGGAWLLTLAFWPGVMETFVFAFPFFCLMLPLLAVWFLLLIVRALIDFVRAPPPEPLRRWGLRSAVIMFVTLGLLILHVPQRISVALFQAPLKRIAEEVLTGRIEEELDAPLWAGPFRIDEVGTDDKGGVYLRTWRGPDGIGPDSMSYGFAYRPGSDATSFGSAWYRRRWLLGPWYAFSVSDDF